jgi:hypothetical protein
MNNREMSRTLKWIALLVVALGAICCVVNIAHFNDRNLGLMIGIGFLVGGIQILVFGAIAPLMQRRQEENVSPLLKSAKD